ncbi:PA2169 family four-helix-bundle protein [Arenimonas sp. MALMAid1274]|uniref:PA2169 family four-helix-bundle protein n=1 Tax=Arenimonas sp. MALMAid1274 TaxID=3411630 RepID=UPI003B9EBFCF
MTDTTNSISDLIEISEDGIAFYEEAAQKVKDKKLSTLFTRLAKAKSELAAELTGEMKPVTGKKKVARKTDGPLGELSKAYAGLRKQWPESGAERYTRMAEVEGALQLTFQKVVLDRDHSFVVRVLAKQYVSKAEVLNKELRACQRAA